MSTWREALLRDEIELAYGKALPGHVREPGRYDVFGSNGRVGSHGEALVDGPGIVVGRKGTVGAVTYSSEAFWPIDTTYFVVNKGDHSWRYLYYLLLSSGLTGLNSHSAVPGLNREDVYSIAVKIPPRSEQGDIARVLDCVEDAIRFEADLLTHAQEVKGATMRELFTRGLRGEPVKDSEVGSVPESWEIVALGSLGRVGNGSTPKKSVTAFWEGGTFPWLTSAKVYDRQITAAEQFVTEEALTRCHLPVVEPDAVLVAITGQGKTLGHCAVLTIQATINQHLAYIQCDTDKVDPHFLRGYLETQYDNLRQVGAGGGSTKGALTCAFLRGMPVPLPEKNEQRSIVEVLQAVDLKIGLHRQKRTLLESIFNCLLDGLVTGALRVDRLDISVLADVSVLGEPAA